LRRLGIKTVELYSRQYCCHWIDVEPYRWQAVPACGVKDRAGTAEGIQNAARVLRKRRDKPVCEMADHLRRVTVKMSWQPHSSLLLEQPGRADSMRKEVVIMPQRTRVDDRWRRNAPTDVSVYPQRLWLCSEWRDQGGVLAPVRTPPQDAVEEVGRDVGIEAIGAYDGRIANKA
jgi:hypothetical protein